jgi:HEAT repeat protein
MNGDEGKIAALIAGLDDSDKSKIRAAADALIALSPHAPGLRAQLERLLGEGPARNRWAFAYVLGQLPQPSGVTIRALLQGLDHREPDIRWAIALLLTRLASTEAALVNPLLEICRSGTANQKRMSIYCIRDLQLGDVASLQALMAATRDAQSAIRVAAATSLKTRRDVGTPERARLLDLFLTDEDVKVRNAAAITLAQLGSPTMDFIAALRAAAQSENSSLRKAAAAALFLLEGKRPASSGG